MKLPYRPEKDAVLPKALRKHSNGQLPRSALRLCGIGKFLLVTPAAASMKALVAAAAERGIIISATGTYRPYDRQVQVFQERYTRIPLPGRPTKKWEGKTYWQKPRTAMVAVPGTSNHGWGLSIDFATVKDGKTVTMSVKELRWLAKNGPAYGWWNTVSSEPWHWSYCMGDATPPALQTDNNPA
jgi:LAS superfamily LD-carboxypeptidase LdcB